MCIIMHCPVRPPLEDLSNRFLYNCWLSNQDGAGFMWAQDGKLHVDKGYVGFRPFLRRYRKLRKELKVPLVVHLRWASAGDLTEKNMHPHIIDEHSAIVHNGTIRHHKPANKNAAESDTVLFVKDILKKLPDRWWQNKVITSLLQSYIERNRVYYLRSDGSTLIFNKYLGESYDDWWFSNKYYSEPRDKKIDFVYPPDFGIMDDKNAEKKRKEIKTENQLKRCTSCSYSLHYTTEKAIGKCSLCASKEDKAWVDDKYATRYCTTCSVKIDPHEFRAYHERQCKHCNNIDKTPLCQTCEIELLTHEIKRGTCDACDHVTKAYRQYYYDAP